MASDASRTLRALVVGVSAIVAPCLPGPARAQATENPAYQSSERNRDPIPHGWLGATAGISSILVQRTAIGDEPSARDVEGDSTGLGTLGLEYELPIVRYFHGRGFVRYTAWETELSELGGYGSKDLFDFGLAPVVTFPSGRGGTHVFPYIYVPVSLTLSTVGSPPRDEVEESWGVGLGYRVGLGAGMFTKTRGPVGFLINAEWAVQSVEHGITYHAVDGGEPDRTLDVGYLITWFTFSVGIAFCP